MIDSFQIACDVNEDYDIFEGEDFSSESLKCAFNLKLYKEQRDRKSQCISSMTASSNTIESS